MPHAFPLWPLPHRAFPCKHAAIESRGAKAVDSLIMRPGAAVAGSGSLAPSSTASCEVLLPGGEKRSSSGRVLGRGNEVGTTR